VFGAFLGDKEEQKAATERWNAMEKSLGRDKLQPYLLSLAGMLHPTKGDDFTVIRNFALHLVNSGEIAQFSSEVLPASLKAYEAGGVSRTSTRPSLNLVHLIRVSVCALS
jgi:hypothetical protein